MRLLAPVVLPLLAYLAEVGLWQWTAPFAGVLLYPAVFAASWLSGLWGALVATGVSVALVWRFLRVVEWSLHPGVSASLFGVLGLLSGVVHHRVRTQAARSRQLTETLLERAQELAARAEDLALQHTRERVAVEAAGVGVWDIDLRTGEMGWSESQFRILGYTPTVDGRASLAMWEQVMDPLDYARVRVAFDTAREARSLVRLEYEAHRADDGRTFWTRSFGRFLYDEPTGEPTRIVGVCFDDTARHDAEAARLESEELLGQLVQGVREYALVAFDPLGRVVSWNEGAERTYGYRASEVIGRDRAIFYLPTEIEQAAADLRSAAAHGSTEVEGWRLRKDGTRFWASVLMTARKDERGAVRGFLTVARDLTQSRAAEERFRLALEASPSGMVMVDKSGRIVLVNQRTLDLFGYTRDELIGRPVELLVPPSARERHVANRTAYQTTPIERRIEGRHLRGLRKDGSTFPISIGLMPVRGQEETFTVAAVVDMTERRRAEEEVRTTHARLEDQLLALESFSYTVSHNLRAPLRAISAYATFVEESLGERVEPDIYAMLGRMRDAALKMDHLIRDVLSYNQVTRMEVTTAPVDLDGVLAHVVANYADLSPTRVHVHVPLGRVVGQESLLVQIVSNLLENAVKFVPRDHEPSVDVATERSGSGWLRLIVQDNGVGIPPEHWDRIFRPFERLCPSAPGTGIGLAIVRKAVERLGGRVGVESEVGRGSSFWVELPEVKDAP